jgi:hypothetical protein
VYDASKDNGWNYCDPMVVCFHTGTEKGIRKQWEENKGELTKDRKSGVERLVKLIGSTKR